MDNPPIITKLDTANMDAMKDLAETNLKISEGHNSLEELKGLESAYLVEREGKAAATVQRVLDESEGVLTIAGENNDAVRLLAADARGLAGKVIDLFGAVKEVMARFDQKSAIWEKNMQDREDKLSTEKNGLLLTAESLANERKNLDKLALDLNDQEARIDSKKQEVEAMITNKPV